MGCRRSFGVCFTVRVWNMKIRQGLLCCSFHRIRKKFGLLPVLAGEVAAVMDQLLALMKAAAVVAAEKICKTKKSPSRKATQYRFRSAPVAAQT